MRQRWNLFVFLMLFGLTPWIGIGCSGDSDDDDSPAGDDDTMSGDDDTQTGDDDTQAGDDDTEAGDDTPTEVDVPTLTVSWEATGLSQPESARYDASKSVIYVSFNNEDGSSGVAKVGLDGSVQEAEWVSGLSGARGVDVYGDSVFVATNAGLVEINANDGSVTNTYTDANALYLNDVAIDGSGTVYVSDIAANTIYTLSAGTFSVWLQDTALESPNGIYIEDNRLVLASFGVITNYDTFEADPAPVHTVSLSDKSVGTLTPGVVGNLDGIDSDGNGNYFVTDWWAGTLYLVTADGDVGTVLTTGMGTADLSYVQDQNLLLLPVMTEGKVVAYTVE